MLTKKAQNLVHNIVNSKGSGILVKKYRMRGKSIADDLSPNLLYYFFIAYDPVSNLYTCAVVFAKDIDESETFEKYVINRLKFVLEQKEKTNENKRTSRKSTR